MPLIRDEQGRLLRGDGSLAKPPDRSKLRNKGYMYHSSVDRALGAATPLRAEYERLLADPNSTLKSLAAWLHEHGIKVSKGAVHRHRRHFAAEYATIHEAKRKAEAHCEVLGRYGPTVFFAAANGRLGMCMMHDAFALPDQPHLSPQEWATWAKAMQVASGVQAEVRMDEQRQAKEAPKLSQREVDIMTAETVREILGVHF
jgi:hypothetical protein